MSIEAEDGVARDVAAERRAEAVRLIVTRRERAPRSPKMERALKRLIWRYLSPSASHREGAETSSHRGSGGMAEGTGGEEGC